MGFSKKTYTKEELLPFFDRTRSRGPDMSQILETPSGWLCFHRLAIMGLTEAGMQPFELDGDYVVCNGEIYGFRPLKRQLTEKGYSFRSGSDCEILLPLYREYGLEMFAKLDAEFALIIYDSKRDELIAARDPIGIRPLYYGYDRSGAIVFASEPKNLVGLCGKIMPFPPGHYYKDGKFVCYRDITAVREVCRDDIETVCASIREKLKYKAWQEGIVVLEVQQHNINSVCSQCGAKIRRKGADFQCVNGHRGSRYLNMAQNLGQKCLDSFKENQKNK